MEDYITELTGLSFPVSLLIIGAGLVTMLLVSQSIVALLLSDK